MNASKEPKERLVAILASDVVGYSRLMRDDERSTVATLDEYRTLFRSRIETHGGRVVDMSGDSVLAVFESVIGAIKAAMEAQADVADRNAALPEHRRMQFRVGMNLGDILQKEDGSVYGDGVNVAARLEAMAKPGGINVSGSVYDSVRKKTGVQFAFLGDQQLKNIDDPVAVYEIRTDGDTLGPNAKNRSATTAVEIPGESRPTIAVGQIKVISGDDETKSLAEGLYHDVVLSLTRQTAIEVVGAAAMESDAAASSNADFRLDGTIRASGARLRLSFALMEIPTGQQVWSERFDRKLEDIFELEDEISERVASTVRIRIKARALEKFHGTDNGALSIDQLLSKAASYFVTAPGHNDEAEKALQAALDRAPENSMANAMMVMCRYRIFEFTPLEIPEEVKRAIFQQIDRALSSDASSYYAHLMAAIVHQDLKGDFEAALVHAETALDLNPGFSPATAMAGIANIHLGAVESGLEMLQSRMGVGDDPHRFRQLRELAIGHLVNDDVERAVGTVDRLIRQGPDQLRNYPLAASILALAGRKEEAKQRIEMAARECPGLSLASMRPARFGNPAAAEHFMRGLTLAGLST